MLKRFPNGDNATRVFLSRQKDWKTKTFNGWLGLDDLSLYRFLIIALLLSCYWDRCIRAASWQNQQHDMCAQRRLVQPGHPPSPIRDFAVRLKKSRLPSYPLSAQRRLWSDCAPNEDWDQPGHPPSLIRVFAIRLKKFRLLSYHLSARRRLWSGRCPGWSESSPGAHAILLVLSRGGSLLFPVLVRECFNTFARKKSF